MLRRSPIAAFSRTVPLANAYLPAKYTKEGKKRCPQYMFGPDHFELPWYKKINPPKVIMFLLWAYALSPYVDIRKTIPDNEKFLAMVSLQPHGVLGDQFSMTFSKKQVGPTPNEETVIVDPTCMENFMVKPEGTGGTSGAIYKWLNLTDTFPESVTSKLYGLCDAKSQTYQDGAGSQQKTVIHVISPDFRIGTFTDREAALLLAKAYRNVFHEFVRTGKSTLRVPPLAQGVFSGDLVDQMYPLTQEAMLAGFEQLHPYDKRELLTKNIELCIFMEKEWDKYANVWEYVSPASQANPRMPDPKAGKR